jgi:hypothetical protein
VSGGHDPQFAPSASARWIACPGSVALLDSASGPVEETSVYAAEGTVAHKVFERALLQQALPEVGSIVIESGHDIEVTHEMLDSVQWAVDRVTELGPGSMLAETNVQIPVADRTISGTADCILQTHADPTLHVMDLKYGKGVQVAAEHNSQLMLYGWGVLCDLGMLYENVQAITLHVLQPRLDHHDMWSVSVSDLTKWIDGPVATAIHEALSPEPSFGPSEAACRWCPMSGQCAAQASAVANAFPDDDVENDTNNSLVLLGDDELSEYLDFLPFAEAWITALRKHALQTLLVGGDIPGYKVVEGRSSRQWGEEERIIAKLLMEASIDPWQAPKLKSPTAVEDEVGRKAFATHPINKAVVKPAGKPTLAPSTDKRPPWAIAHPEDFPSEK